MPLDSYVPAPPPLLFDKAAIAKTSSPVQKAANWFWWIAGLSVINSLVALGGGNFNFVVGLGITQFADAAFQNLKILALVFDLLVLAFFFFAGFFARKGQLWAFVVGGIAYVADAAIFALVGEWFPFGFHAYALVYIVIGAKELRTLLKAAREQPAAPPFPLPVIEATIIPEAGPSS